jgi:hypothetical protein
MSHVIAVQACSSTCTRVTFQSTQYLRFEIQEQAVSCVRVVFILQTCTTKQTGFRLL